LAILIRSANQSKPTKVLDPFYIAATGWTTDDLATAISIQGPRPVYNAVTLLIGVNDQFQRHDTSGYREKFGGLLNTAIAYAGNLNDHVFVLSIPDYSVTPAAGNYDTAFIRKQVNEFNDINRSVTMQQHCNYLDITPSTREALTDSTLIANDGLHPSGKEYHKWALRLSALMYPVLR
jgi:lysophospholipase L1-like esterase